VAISNRRILNLTDKEVTFSYLDCEDGYKRKTITLTGEQFPGRFLRHILPSGFTRIRHYGFLSPRNKTRALDIIRKCLNVIAPVIAKLSWVDIVRLRWGYNPMVCTLCGGKLVISPVIPKQRAPPLSLFSKRDKIIKNFYQAVC